MLKADEKKDLIHALRNFDTVAEMFNYLFEVYDLENAKLGMVTKPLFIEGAVKALNLTNPKKR